MTSGKVKPWQIVLFIAAVGALGWSVWSVLSRDVVRVSDEVVLVDLASGKLYIASTDSMIVPAKSPDTGERTLYPVSRTADGAAWVLSEKARAFAGSDFVRDGLINAGSWTLNTTGEPERYSRP